MMLPKEQGQQQGQGQGGQGQRLYVRYVWFGITLPNGAGTMDCLVDTPCFSTFVIDRVPRVLRQSIQQWYPHNPNSNASRQDDTLRML